jgi:putative membrane protein
MSELAEQFLTQEERERIVAAVKEVEKTTSGEIVPFVASSSYGYPRATLAGALGLGLAVAVAAVLVTGWNDAWTLLIVFAVVFALLYFTLERFPKLRRWFVTRAEIEEEVAEAATTAFFKHNLYRTRDRTGILIYISVFERKVWVLADEGINAKVGQETWKEIVGMVTKGIRQGRQADAMCQAVHRCGELIRHHFPIKPDDKDELVNLIVE